MSQDRFKGIPVDHREASPIKNPTPTGSWGASLDQRNWLAARCSKAVKIVSLRKLMRELGDREAELGVKVRIHLSTPIGWVTITRTRFLDLTKGKWGTVMLRWYHYDPRMDDRRPRPDGHGREKASDILITWKR